MSALKKTISRSAAPVGAIGTVGGFISDVLAPLGSFAPWLALLSLGGVVTAAFFMWKSRSKQGADVWDSPVAALLLICAGSTLVFGGWSVVSANGPENGYLADNIEPIAEIQASLLNLEEDMAQIQETTEEIQETTEEIQETTEEIQETTEEIQETTEEIQETTEETADTVAIAATAQAQGFAELQASFAGLQAGQAIIDNPTTPQEWYNYARLYQLRGDVANARLAYEQFFTFGLEYVDPYQQYVALLKASEGIAQTRTIIAEMAAENPKNRALELTHTLLLEDSAAQLAQLESLTNRAPDFGPGFFGLGQAYDDALRDNVTTLLLEGQAAAYETLLQMEEEAQLFTRYYLDKILADEELETAALMLDSYSQAAETFSNVDIQVTYFAQGVQFLVLIPEMGTAQKMLFSFDNPEPSIDAGRMAGGTINTVIGPVPDLELGDHIFYVQYIDVNGEPSQIFEQPFRIDPIAIYFQQQPMDFSTGLVPGAFNLAIPGLTAPVDYTYQYSLDNDSLDQSFTTSGFGGFLQIEGLTPGEHTLYIQATGSDGTSIEMIEFTFMVN